ncbi:cadherin-like domain-containing protein, partial [Streptomyces albiflaviniger]|nr:cadherin-like domain-containing protein [Streptomyces albiflaviniger]
VVGFTGAVGAVTYRVTDAYAQTGSAAVSVTVNTPAAPVVAVTSPSTAWFTPIVFTPSTSGTGIVNATACIVDPGDSVCKTSVAAAGEGTFTVNTSTRAVTFSPVESFSGTTAAVTYRVSDAYGQTSAGTNNVTVAVAV